VGGQAESGLSSCEDAREGERVLPTLEPRCDRLDASIEALNKADRSAAWGIESSSSS